MKMVDLRNNSEMRALAIVDRDEVLEMVEKIELELKSQSNQDVILNELNKIRWKLAKRIVWEEIDE
jgi:hypothetical protein